MPLEELLFELHESTLGFYHDEVVAVLDGLE